MAESICMSVPGQLPSSQGVWGRHLHNQFLLCQGMATALCRAADALCSARSVRIAFFFPACIWKGTIGFVLLQAETFMLMDVAVDHDFCGVPPPSVLRHWERWREQTVSSAFGKPKLEGCRGPGHRLPGALRLGTWPGAFGKVPISRGRQCLARMTWGTQKPCWAIVSVAV